MKKILLLLCFAFCLSFSFPEEEINVTQEISNYPIVLRGDLKNNKKIAVETNAQKVEKFKKQQSEANTKYNKNVSDITLNRDEEQTKLIYIVYIRSTKTLNNMLTIYYLQYCSLSMSKKGRLIL